VFDNSKTTRKLSAGWLIDQAGWKGKKLGKVGTHEHNALVLVNKGKAKLQDVLKLQKKIEEAVWKKFKVKLIREPRVLA
jgi:UDP-N-acetylmuramate dehydrogenase